MTTFLPRDANHNAIPALRMMDGGAHTISATGTSARNTSAFDSGTRVMSIYATQPIYIAFGGASVTAASSDHYFPAGLYYDVAIGGDTSAHKTHMAVLAADSDGTVFISEKA